MIFTGCLRISPKGLLLLFCMINFILFVDRGTFSGLLLEIEDSLQISSSEAGLLGSGFILGFCISNPILIVMAKEVHPLWLIATGLSVLFVSLFFTGFTDNYFLLLTLRIVTGVSEAAFSPFAPVYILEIAPVNQSAKWLALFYSMIYLGNSFGYAYGVFLANRLGSWHWPFIVSSITIIPCIVVLFFSHKSEHLKFSKNQGNFTKKSKKILNNPVFICLALANASIIFSIGGFAYWGPTFIHSLYGTSSETASYTIGAIFFLTGISGSAIGSSLLDFILAKDSKRFIENEISERELNHQRIKATIILLLIMSIVALLAGLIGNLFHSYSLFLGSITIMFFCVAFGLGIFHFAMLSCIPVKLRSQATSILIFITLLLGTLPAPFIIGMLFEHFGSQWTFLIVILWLVWAPIFLGSAWNSIVTII